MLVLVISKTREKIYVERKEARIIMMLFVGSQIHKNCFSNEIKIRSFVYSSFSLVTLVKVIFIKHFIHVPFVLIN